MKKLLIILLFGFCPVIGMSQSGCHVFGKIKFVDYGEDYKVKFVDYGEDLKIKYVNYGEKNVGKWKSVSYGDPSTCGDHEDERDAPRDRSTVSPVLIIQIGLL